MKHIFGFCEDYDKIVYGLKHNLTLVRKADDDAIFRGAAAGAGKVSLDKISWFIPHDIPADAKKISITRLWTRKLSYQLYTERDNVICYQFLNRQVSHGD